MGPGTYNADDSLTKPKMPNINMGSSPSRPQSFAQGGDVDVAPGQYNHEKPFGADVKSLTIGQNRPDVRPHQGSGMGPGTYNPDNALTKPKMPNIDMGSSPSRP